MTLRIKELRLARGLSQKKLAELAELPRSTLGEMENHMILPKQEYLERIAKVLGVTADELYK